MNRTTSDPATVKTFAARAAELAAAGYTPGAPPQVSGEALRIDARICRAYRCPGCRRRGMLFRPYHRGASYRALAACVFDGCGAVDEL
jgi:hypothetical protein